MIFFVIFILLETMANRSGDNFYNETGMSFNNNPASLKGKLQTLEVLRIFYEESNQEY